MEKKYKIHEAAKRIGVSPSLIRYYEEKGMIEVEKDPGNGYRLFSEADIFKIWLITFHRTMNMSLGDIDGLMHGYSLEETRNSIGQHREKMLCILEEAQKNLAVCDFYDRYISLAQRVDMPPEIIKERRFFLYMPEDIYCRRKPSFPACTFGSVFEKDEEHQYSMVYEEDLHLLTAEEQAQCQKELVLKDIISVIVNVDDISFATDALKKGLDLAKSAGFDVCEPYYALYLLSFGGEDSLGYSYEILMTLPKGS